MARYRLSRLAEADLAQIFATSEERWGPQARRRYAALLAGAMRKAGAAPHGPATRQRSELLKGIRSLHVRLARVVNPGSKVRQPVHVIYFRVLTPDTVEIVRVLHERMEPGRHLGGPTEA